MLTKKSARARDAIREAIEDYKKRRA